MNRGMGAHSGNPDVRKMVLEEKKPAVVAWAVERKDGGRGFGFTGGHFHKGWANDSQRTLVLNAIAWTAKAEVPALGVASKFTDEQLAANQDPKGRKPATPAPKPAGTPAAIVNKLNAEIARLLLQRDVRDRFAALGFEPSRGSPAEFGALIKSDIVKWATPGRISSSYGIS